MTPNQSNIVSFRPRHNAHQNQKYDRQSWTSGDNEKVYQNGTDHDRNKKKGADPRESRDQKQNRRREFDEPRHVTKPLANANSMNVWTICSSPDSFANPTTKHKVAPRT